MDETLTIEEIIKAKIHLGHRSRDWHPNIKPYIFTTHKGIHIIDPEKIITQIKKATDGVKDIISKGKSILFVGTKRQFAGIIKEEAIRCGAFYINNRWLGGTLTNFPTIRKSIEKLHSLEEKLGNNTALKKKELLSLERKLAKIRRNLEGVKDMTELPDIIYIVDIRREDIAVQEAIKLNIPIVAIVDTNSNPDKITYPIPGNDDSMKSVRFITKIIADAVLEAKNGESRS